MKCTQWSNFHLDFIGWTGLFPLLHICDVLVLFGIRIWKIGVVSLVTVGEDIPYPPHRFWIFIKLSFGHGEVY